MIGFLKNPADSAGLSLFLGIFVSFLFGGGSSPAFFFRNAARRGCKTHDDRIRGKGRGRKIRNEKNAGAVFQKTGGRGGGGRHADDRRQEKKTSGKFVNEKKAK